MTNDNSDLKNSQSQKTNKTEKLKFCLKNAKPHCKKALSSKTFIAILFTLLGVCGTVLAQSKDYQRREYAESFPTWPDRYDKEFSALHHYDPFFDDYGIFAEMRHMQHRMNEIFSNHHRYMSEALEKAKINTQDTRAQVSKKEDDENYYYEMDFAGFKKEDVVVSVKNDILTFSAKKKIDDKDKKSYATSDFYYSFSVPKRDKDVAPEIVKEDNKVLVTFAKAGK